MRNSKFLVCSFAGLILTGTANAASVYADNISATNINILSERMMSFVHRGEKLSKYFTNKIMYGTMTRFDEYGDDGSTLIGNNITPENPTDGVFKDIWADANYINGHTHFSGGNTAQSKFFMGTVGGETSDIDVRYGNISFGGFAGYINGEIDNSDSHGNAIGLFSNYRYKIFDAAIMIDNGSLKSDYGINNYSNAWFNVAMDASVKIKIDDTLYLEPRVYAGYTWVSSDTLIINSDVVSGKNFGFWNLAPSARFIKNISDNWYGTLSGKYVAIFNDNNDVYINGVRNDGVEMDNYFEIATGAEYGYDRFVFTGAITKQIGGFDAWGGNVNVKYLF